LKKSTKLPKWVFHQNSQHHQEKKISWRNNIAVNWRVMSIRMR
jgi:hypothetical protein